MKLASTFSGAIALLALTLQACGGAGGDELNVGRSSADPSTQPSFRSENASPTSAERGAAPSEVPAVNANQKSYADQQLGEGDLLVNVNTATLEELESIPGIGPAKAKEIVRERPYRTIEDLIRVKGIGQYTLNSIRPYVTIEGKTRKR